MATEANQRVSAAVWHRWPAVLGLAAAAFQLLTSPDADGVATTVGVAVVCYLGAAALDRPWVAWGAIPPASLLIVASEILGLRWWVAFAVLALGLVVTGVLLRVPRPALTAQTAALIGFGGLAVAALALSPRAGLALVGVVLASHAIWDAIHYRRNQVVPRSLAEFCMLLDVVLGAGAVVLAITG
jgi:hypothetical protein